MKFDERERVRYEKFKQYLHDQASAWESTYVIGKIEGIEQGIEQEKQKSQKKIVDIAKSLLDVLNSKTIALKTGLSVKEIERLRS